MKIAVFNKKGGVGKTSISYSIAKDLDYFLISNDDSTIEIAYPGKAKIMKEPKLINNCVYDFGGFVDLNILKILNESDLVIVPLNYDLNSFKKTISTLEEIENKNIIFVINRAVKNDYLDIKKHLKSNYNYPIFEIKDSKIWVKTFIENKSVSEIKNSSKINKYIYRNSITEYENLLNLIKKKGN